MAIGSIYLLYNMYLFKNNNIIIITLLFIHLDCYTSIHQDCRCKQHAGERTLRELTTHGAVT